MLLAQYWLHVQVLGAWSTVCQVAGQQLRTHLSCRHRDSEEGMQAGPLLEQDVGDVLEDFKRLAKELQTDAFRGECVWDVSERIACLQRSPTWILPALCMALCGVWPLQWSTDIRRAAQGAHALLTCSRSCRSAEGCSRVKRAYVRATGH